MFVRKDNELQKSICRPKQPKQKQLTEQGRQAEQIRNLTIERLSESKERNSVDGESPISFNQNKGLWNFVLVEIKYEQDIALREKATKIERK